MGNRLEECKAVFSSIGGLLPITGSLSDVLQDQILTGSLNMHEKGLIFMDTRQGALFVPYKDLSKITFYDDGLSMDSNKNIWV